MAQEIEFMIASDGEHEKYSLKYTMKTSLSR